MAVSPTRNKPTADGDQYQTAGWIRENLGVVESRLLRLLAWKLIRVRGAIGALPTYSVNDVKSHINLEDGLHAPEAAAERKRTRAAGNKRAAAASTRLAPKRRSR